MTDQQENKPGLLCTAIVWAPLPSFMTMVLLLIILTSATFTQPFRCKVSAQEYLPCFCFLILISSSYNHPMNGKRSLSWGAYCCHYIEKNPSFIFCFEAATVSLHGIHWPSWPNLWKTTCLTALLYRYRPAGVHNHTKQRIPGISHPIPLFFHRSNLLVHCTVRRAKFKTSTPN